MADFTVLFPFERHRQVNAPLVLRSCGDLLVRAAAGGNDRGTSFTSFSGSHVFINIYSSVLLLLEHPVGPSNTATTWVLVSYLSSGQTHTVMVETTALLSATCCFSFALF